MMILKNILYSMRMAFWSFLVAVRKPILMVLTTSVALLVAGTLLGAFLWYMSETPESIETWRLGFFCILGVTIVFSPLPVLYDLILFWLEPKDRTTVYFD